MRWLALCAVLLIAATAGADERLATDDATAIQSELDASGRTTVMIILVPPPGAGEEADWAVDDEEAATKARTAAFMSGLPASAVIHEAGALWLRATLDPAGLEWVLAHAHTEKVGASALLAWE